MTTAQRVNNLLPSGIPKWIRCYDNGGETFDRYTVCYTRLNGCRHPYIGMSDDPCHPQGFGQHGEGGDSPIDRPAYGHLGKRIQFADLPANCQQLVLSEYCAIWGINK